MEVRGEDADDTRSHRHPGVLFWVGLSHNCLVFLESPCHGTPREGSGLLSVEHHGEQTDGCP